MATTTAKIRSSRAARERRRKGSAPVFGGQASVHGSDTSATTTAHSANIHLRVTAHPSDDCAGAHNLISTAHRSTTPKRLEDHEHTLPALVFSWEDSDFASASHDERIGGSRLLGQHLQQPNAD